MARRYYFVVNPRSANGRTGRDWERLRPQVEAQFGQIGWSLTTGPLHAQSLTREALRAGHDAIVAMGGDGTVNEVLNGFYEAGQPIRPGAALGYLPSGTGGDLARTLELAGRSRAEQLQQLATETPRLLDHGRATFQSPEHTEITRYFMNEASVGFSANTVDSVNHATKALGGRASFLIGVLRCLSGLHHAPVEVTVDGQLIHDGPAFMAAISNGKYFGGGMAIAPHARLDDGMLELVLLNPLHRRDILLHMRKIYRGEHLTMPEVTLVSGKQIEICSCEKVLLEMDGEQPGNLPARFEVMERAIPFLCATPPEE